MSAPETPDATPAPAGKAKKTILLAVVVVLGIGLGGAGGVMMAGPLLAGGTPPAKAAADHGDEADEEEEHEEGAEGDTAAPAAVYLVENLVLNPAGTNGSRFLLLTIGLSVPDDAASKTLQARDPELRDVVIRRLGTRSVEELADITRRDSLKADLRTALVERFGKKSVLDVYFPQFVIQ